MKKMNSVMKATEILCVWRIWRNLTRTSFLPPVTFFMLRRMNMIRNTRCRTSVLRHVRCRKAMCTSIDASSLKCIACAGTFSHNISSNEEKLLPLKIPAVFGRSHLPIQCLWNVCNQYHVWQKAISCLILVIREAEHSKVREHIMMMSYNRS
jgi:hypothetical protein